MKVISLITTLIFIPALLCAQAKPDAHSTGVKKTGKIQSAPAAETSAKAADPFDAAIGELKAGDVSGRRQAANKLAQLRDPKAAPALMAALNDSSPEVRQAAADALGLMIWRPAATKLSQMLVKDSDANVRQQAAISLSYIADPKAGPALTEALKDDSQPVRYAALHTLGTIKYAPAEEQVIKLLSSDDANIRRGAISALGELKSGKAVGAISAALNDSDQFVKMEAIKALGNIGAPSAAPELIKLLAKTEQPGVRVGAALSLSKMGMNDGLLTAFEFVQSPELSLRSQSMNVIAAVGDARSLQFIDELYKTEQDPSIKSMLDFTRQRISARLKLN